MATSKINFFYAKQTNHSNGLPWLPQFPLNLLFSWFRLNWSFRTGEWIQKWRKSSVIYGE